MENFIENYSEYLSPRKKKRYWTHERTDLQPTWEADNHHIPVKLILKRNSSSSFPNPYMRSNQKYGTQINHTAVNSSLYITACSGIFTAQTIASVSVQCSCQVNLTMLKICILDFVSKWKRWQPEFNYSCEWHLESRTWVSEWFCHFKDGTMHPKLHTLWMSFNQ